MIKNNYDYYIKIDFYGKKKLNQKGLKCSQLSIVYK